MPRPSKKPLPAKKLPRTKKPLPAKGRKPVSGKRPVALSKIGRHQVGVTGKVKHYVAKFSGSPLARVEKIVADIAGFNSIELPVAEAGKFWAKRSAEEIIETKSVVVAKQPVPNGAPEISGCTDHACAICSAVRAIGLNAVFVRMGNHSHVEFSFRGNAYIADPTKERRPIVRRKIAADYRNERFFEKKGAYAKGASPAKIGLTKAANFYKYSAGPVTQGK